ncbi:NAD-binding protein [Gloeocapsa sp. PCC 7428]|uniref:NAD-binding protein n=1 Tax=Gloeocapsa sp. PCC 7428 TaxID=1173026 RepID=UPI0002E4F2F0|nr:NAD-binding protein [Gloeocapsa sp. PCC 7428]
MAIADAKAEAKGYFVKHGNAADETILYAVGIQRAKALATVLPDDAINVFSNTKYCLKSAIQLLLWYIVAISLNLLRITY